ncbi:MAG: hypothetical protein QG670_1771 [Thermoproteota archaeon]|nr:hypothetical protein [Thermoproteota archaeon]
MELVDLSSSIALRFGKWVSVNDVAEYILLRQNDDGGYTFAQWTDSSAQDTFFAVEVLKILGVQPRKVREMAGFLKRLQHPDGSFDSVRVAYYVVKTLAGFGENPSLPVVDYILFLKREHGGFSGLEAFWDVPSEIEDTYLALEVLREACNESKLESTAELILKSQNKDGSFGKTNYSRIASTYYALASLKILGYNVENFKETLKWLRGMELPQGGFGEIYVNPEQYIGIEDVYFGVKALEILNESLTHPKEALDLISQFRNNNGGFRRSNVLGISTFEATYQAMAAMESILT